MGKFFLFLGCVFFCLLASASQPNTSVVAKGLVLLGPNEPLLSSEELENLGPITFIGCDLPGDKQFVMGEIKKLFHNTPFTSSLLGRIRSILQEHYDAYGHPLVAVDIPEQEVTDGVVQMRIQEAVLGELTVTGNRWTSSASATCYLKQVKPGQVVDEIEIFRALYAMNANPFRRVDVLYSPGSAEGTTDVELQVQDRFPLRTYAGSDNTGVDPVDQYRWFAGFNWNLPFFKWNQILSYQYTTAYQMRRFQAHTIQYLALFPWKHSLSLYGGYNHVEPTQTTPPMLRNTGWGMQASMRYELPWHIRRYFEDELTLGFDFKRTNNTFVFTDTFSRFGKNVNLTQIVVGYSGIFENNNCRLDFQANCFGSFGGCFDDQTDADYQSLRIGAKNQWIYCRGGACYLQTMGKTSVSLAARGQWTTTPLLPSEQFGLGGYDTVRGYEERVINKDNAYVLNLEFRSAPGAIFPYACRRYTDAIQLLAFADYGWGTDKVPNPPSPVSEFLASIGPGVRYTFEPYMTGRLDLGFKLHKNSVIGTKIARLHFSLIFSI